MLLAALGFKIFLIPLHSSYLAITNALASEVEKTL
jgi:hypothetical protein